jgi:hypothetical protein
MRSLLDNATFVKYHNAVRVPNIGQSMRDQGRGSGGLADVAVGVKGALKGGEYARFCLGVQSCCGFIGDRDGRVAIDAAGDGDSLPLPA